MGEEYIYPEEEYILLGKIAKAHGLKGEVKVFSYSGHPENIGTYGELVLVDGSGTLSTPLAVLRSRVQGKMAIVQLESVNSRNEAESIEGRGVLLSKVFLPDADDDEYYWHQYEGKLVVHINSTVIGRIEALFNNGAHDVLVVESGGQEILIPVTKEIVVKEDEEKLVVDPPPGLLELSSDNDE
ncbi:MAG: ribosome maturation factor RimM [Desulforhopalus sp.]